MVHVKWLLVAVLAAGAGYGYAWIARPNPPPADCVRALDLTRRIDAASAAFARTGPGTPPPDVANIGQLRADRDVADVRCRDSGK